MLTATDNDLVAVHRINHVKKYNWLVMGQPNKKKKRKQKHTQTTKIKDTHKSWKPKIKVGKNSGQLHKSNSTKGKTTVNKTKKHILIKTTRIIASKHNIEY